MTYAINSIASTIAAGASRTFEMRPGMYLQLTAPPNTRATVTETPLAVPASDTTGKITPRVTRIDGMPVSRVFGPYETGANVVVANAANSGGTIACVYAASGPVVIVGEDAPVDLDGYPDGTVYIQTGA